MRMKTLDFLINQFVESNEGVLATIKLQQGFPKQLPAKKNERTGS